MTVLIVGGDELARAGCASLIGDVLDVVKIDLCDDYTPLADSLENDPPGWVVVLGWSIDLGRVVEVCRKAGECAPGQKTGRQPGPAPGMLLVHTAGTLMSEPGRIREGLDLGFNGVLSADSDLSILSAILKDAPNDVVYISRDIIDLAISQAPTKVAVDIDAPGATGVVAENADLLDCIAKGRSNKEIARDFGVSEDRIKARVRQIMRLLGVNKRTQLATAYLQEVAGLGTGAVTFESRPDPDTANDRLSA